jgi:putative addiction module antidote
VLTIVDTCVATVFLGEDLKMTTLKVRKIGNSLGVVLSKEVISRLGVESGDDLFLIKAKSGYQITPYDPEFAAQVSVAEKIMKKRRNMLRKLAE